MALSSKLCLFNTYFNHCSIMSKISTFKLEGPVPAVFTPLAADGSLDLPKIETYCNYLVQNGISQVFVNGTTGEGCVLTLEERKLIIEKWMEVKKKSGGKLKSVVAQVGTVNLHDTQVLARHAASVGVDAISTLAPLFFKPKTVEYLVRYCREVAATAPDLPFYYYHVPVMTGVEINVEDFLREGLKEIPSLAGAKFSSQDLVDLIGCTNLEAPHRESKKFNILYGNDAQLMAGLVLGADGGVGSTYNFFPKMILRIMKNVSDGKINEARAEQLHVQQFARARNKFIDLAGHNVAALKSVMSLIGLDLGPSRAPFCGLTVEERENFRKELEKIGFFTWNN